MIVEMKSQDPIPGENEHREIFNVAGRKGYNAADVGSQIMADFPGFGRLRVRSTDVATRFESRASQDLLFSPVA